MEFLLTLGSHVSHILPVAEVRPKDLQFHGFILHGLHGLHLPALHHGLGWGCRRHGKFHSTWRLRSARRSEVLPKNQWILPSIDDKT